MNGAFEGDYHDGDSRNTSLRASEAKDKPMHSKAIEAAGDAVRNNMIYVVSAQEAKVFTQAAVQAYLAAMEAEGFGFVQTRQIKVISGPPIYDPRPNVKG